LPLTLTDLVMIIERAKRAGRIDSAIAKSANLLVSFNEERIARFDITMSTAQVAMNTNERVIGYLRSKY
jgi:hypothetical protein